MSLVTVTFAKWEKYQIRKDIKHRTWFAVSNRITEDDQIQTLDDSEFRAFMHLLCLASQANKSTFEVNLAKVERISGISQSVFSTTIKKLNDFNICTQSVRDPYVERTQSVQNPVGTLHYTTLHNTTHKALAPKSVVSKPPRKRQEIFNPQNVEEIQNQIEPECHESWRKLYPDEKFLSREWIKAFEYYRNAGRKRPNTIGGWKRVLSSWFERGWSKFAAALPGPVQNTYGSRTDYGPKPVKYPDAESVLEEQHTNGQDKRGDPAATAHLRLLMAKAGNLGVKKQDG